MHDRIVLLEKKVSCLYEDFNNRSNHVWSEADPSTMSDLENRARAMSRLLEHCYKEYRDDRICHQHGMDVLMYKEKKLDKALANIASLQLKIEVLERHIAGPCPCCKTVHSYVDIPVPITIKTPYEDWCDEEEALAKKF